jgi:hypothetical protein
MATVDSIRSFHTELAIVCDSLESLFNLAGEKYSEFDFAARPALYRFRDLLDQADSLCGSDFEASTGFPNITEAR